MNGRAHVHEVEVWETNDHKYWVVRYGDHRHHFRKPKGPGSSLFHFIPASPEVQETALRGHIKAVILRHDTASRVVAQQQEIIQRATPTIIYGERWASDQIEDMK